MTFSLVFPCDRTANTTKAGWFWSRFTTQTCELKATQRGCSLWVTEQISYRMEVLLPCNRYTNTQFFFRVYFIKICSRISFLFSLMKKTKKTHTTSVLPLKHLCLWSKVTSIKTVKPVDELVDTGTDTPVWQRYRLKIMSLSQQVRTTWENISHTSVNQLCLELVWVNGCFYSHAAALG